MTRLDSVLAMLALVSSVAGFFQPPKNMEFIPKNPVAFEDASFGFKCEANGGAANLDLRLYIGSELVTANVKHDSRGAWSYYAFHVNRKHHGAEIRCCAVDPATLNILMEIHTTLTVNYSPTVSVGPYFNPFYIQKGHSTQLECLYDANPTPRIQWYHNKRLISNAVTLSLNKVTAQDEGTYTCRADNSYNPVREASLHLQILDKPVQVDPYKEVDVGEKLTVTCLIESLLRPLSIWWLDGKSRVVSHSSILVLEQVSLDDAGIYCCVAKYSADMSDNDTMQLVVRQRPGVTPIVPEGPPVTPDEISGPIFIQHPSDLTVKVGDTNLQLECIAQGKPRPSIRWYKNGATITSGTWYQIDEQVSQSGSVFQIQSTLKFQGMLRSDHTQIVESDEGNYTCMAQNDAGAISSTSVLGIEYGPQFIKTKFMVDFWPKGTLTCVTKADPRPEFSWLFQDLHTDPATYKKEVTDLGNDMYSGSLIVDVNKLKSPIITCVASNKVGKLSADVDLTSEGVLTPSPSTVGQLGPDINLTPEGVFTPSTSTGKVPESYPPDNFHARSTNHATLRFTEKPKVDLSPSTRAPDDVHVELVTKPADLELFDLSLIAIIGITIFLLITLIVSLVCAWCCRRRPLKQKPPNTHTIVLSPL